MTRGMLGSLSVEGTMWLVYLHRRRRRYVTAKARLPYILASRAPEEGYVSIPFNRRSFPYRKPSLSLVPFPVPSVSMPNPGRS